MPVRPSHLYSMFYSISIESGESLTARSAVNASFSGVGLSRRSAAMAPPIAPTPTTAIDGSSLMAEKLQGQYT